MSYTFLQEQGEESSAASFSDIPAFVLSRLNLTADKSYSSDNGTASCPSSQSGMMSEPFTGSRGEDLSMSFAEVSRARGLAQPVTAEDLSTKITTRRASESFARLAQDLSCWKIPHYSLFGDLEMFCGTWPRWGMMQDGVCWELSTSELPTKENEFGYWPTADASGAQEGEGLSTWLARREKLKESRKNGNGCGMPLSIAVKLHSWGTPTARDHKDTGTTSNVPENGLLGRMVKSFAGQMVKGGCVHPQFHCWLMGWPTEWTALEPLAMAKFQQWLHSHGKHFALAQPDPPDE